jgi:hypothetical protein
MASQGLRSPRNRRRFEGLSAGPCHRDQSPLHRLALFCRHRLSSWPEFSKGIRIGSADHSVGRLTKHGGEEAATHGNRAPSSKREWWDHLYFEQQAFVFSTRKGNLEGLKEAVEAGASVETSIDETGARAYHCAAAEGHFDM